MNYNDTFELSDEQKAMFNKKNAGDIFPYHYLIRVNQFDDNARNTIDEWLYFFKNSEIKDEFTAKGLKEAREKLKTINMPPEELAAYNRYLDKLSSDASIAETMKFEVEYKARKQREIEIATNMINKGYNNETISDLTNLPEAEIEKLRNELKNK